VKEHSAGAIKADLDEETEAVRSPTTPATGRASITTLARKEAKTKTN